MGSVPMDEMSLADAYLALGLTENPTSEAVERAFRRLAQTAHPDRGGCRQEWDRLVEARTVALREHTAVSVNTSTTSELELASRLTAALRVLESRDGSSEVELTTLRRLDEASRVERAVIRSRTSRLAAMKRRAWWSSSAGIVILAGTQAVAAIGPQGRAGQPEFDVQLGQWTLPVAAVIAMAGLLGAIYKIRAERIEHAIADLSATVSDLEVQRAISQEIAWAHSSWRRQIADHHYGGEPGWARWKLADLLTYARLRATDSDRERRDHLRNHRTFSLVRAWASQRFDSWLKLAAPAADVRSTPWWTTQDLANWLDVWSQESEVSLRAAVLVLKRPHARAYARERARQRARDDAQRRDGLLSGLAWVTEKGDEEGQEDFRGYIEGHDQEIAAKEKVRQEAMKEARTVKSKATAGRKRASEGAHLWWGLLRAWRSSRSSLTHLSRRIGVLDTSRLLIANALASNELAEKRSSSGPTRYQWGAAEDPKSTSGET